MRRRRWLGSPSIGPPSGHRRLYTWPRHEVEERGLLGWGGEVTHLGFSL